MTPWLRRRRTTCRPANEWHRKPFANQDFPHVPTIRLHRPAASFVIADRRPFRSWWASEKRGRLIKQLEDALLLSDELNDPSSAVYKASTYAVPK
jgi:hypothetical protein